VILLISASQVARIAYMTYWCPASGVYFKVNSGQIVKKQAFLRNVYKVTFAFYKFKKNVLASVCAQAIYIYIFLSIYSLYIFYIYRKAGPQTFTIHINFGSDQNVVRPW
jgi:hypothetical protein